MTGLMILLATLTAPGDAWELLAKEDGVRVWRREAPGQDVPTFRAETTVEAPIDVVRAVIMDVGQMATWDSECARSEVLHRATPDRVLWRYVSDVPWPASDREAILWSEARVLEVGRRVRILFRRANDSEAPPPADGLVRVPRLEGHWDLAADGAGRTKVEYRATTSAGGAVPDFVVTHMGKASPLALLRGLRKRLRAWPTER